jgi:hypothetical protein
LVENQASFVSVEEATEQVRVMARRLAVLYHYTAEVLAEELGDEQAEALLRKIIWRYGTESGLTARRKVQAMGLTLTIGNFGLGSDLPKYGWESEQRREAGEERTCVTYCPFAKVWQEKGSERWGQIYCLVDEAKYRAYNGALCRHAKHVLRGDEGCLFDIQDDPEYGKNL